MAVLKGSRAAIGFVTSVGRVRWYAFWMSVASGIAIGADKLSFLPDSMLRWLLLWSVRRADEAARGLDWSEQDRIESARRALFLDSAFRNAATALLDYDPVTDISERPAYVGTVTATGRDAEEALEEWLEAAGFRRNPVAYLKYRTRDGTEEYEQGSWAYRREADAETQLHVRLFDGADEGAVDVYAHREPSITRGQEHLGRPNYRLGVCETKAGLVAWAEDEGDVSFERMAELPTGTNPRDHDCSDASPILGGDGNST